MEKEKRILFYFIGWFIVAICIFLIGVLNVNAATYYMNSEYLQKYYDNNGSSVTAITTTWNESLQSYVSGNITTVANSYGAGLSITSPIPLIANHTYTLSIYFDGISNIAKSSKNNIAISTSLTGAAQNYADGNYWVDMVQTNVSNSKVIQFVFTTKGGGNFIFFPWTTTSTSTQSYVLTQIVMEDLGSEGVSQDDINNSLNNQTNELNNSIQNSTDTITGEIDDMEQNIIDSNKETQDVIKEQFNSCDNKGLQYVKTLNNVYLNYDINNTTLISTNDLKVLVYQVPKINESYQFIFKGIDRLRIAESNILFNGASNETLKSLMMEQNPIIGETYTINTTKKYIYFYVSNSSADGEISIIEKEICSNKIDETNDKLDNLTGSLNDSNVDGSLGDAGGFFNNFSTSDHGGLSGIITAPLVAINQMLNTSCSPMTTTFKGKELSLPCGYEFWNKMGPIQDFVNLVLGGLLCYQIIIKLYKLIEKIKNPEDDRLEVMDL